MNRTQIMKIISLELIGYKRFSLSNIGKLKITATSNIQIILGTNGSGKSSLLEALSPYPQSSSDFVKGGSKVLELEHNNAHYLLVSKYNGAAKHQFIKDGIALNEGSTASVQKELVERELGFSNHLHTLLTGELTFTDMPPAQRREWIMRISNVDLNYALDTYNNIKTKLRDAQGALKHDEIRLGRESQKLLDEVNLNSIKEENDLLQKHISFYLTQKKTNLPNQRDIEQEYKALSKKIEDLSDSLLKANFSYSNKTKIKRYEEIIAIEQEFISTDKVHRAILLEQENQLKEDKETLKQLQDEGATNQEGLENKLKTLRKDRALIQPISDGFIIDGEASKVLSDTNGVRVNLSELVAEASGDKITVPAKELWDQHSTKLVEVEKKIQSLENLLIRLFKNKESMENAHKNECPKCKYVWKPGISEVDLERVKIKITNYTETQTKLITEQKRLKSVCENIDTRKSEIDCFRGLAHSYPRLRIFWNHIAENQFLHNNPKDIIISYQTWLESVKQAVKINTLDEETQSVEATLNRLKNIGDKVDIDYFVKKEKTVSDKIEKTLLALEDNIKKIDEIKKYKRDFASVANETETLVGYITRLKELEDLILDGKIQKEITDQLEQTQLSLSNNRRKQTEAETLNGIVEDLKNNIEQLKIDIKALSALEKALSPLDGIIAETMIGFIESFVGQLNDLIERVWEYDMKILPCSTSNNELDYRFPLEVMGRETPVPDIAKGSSGQKDIINFVFTLAVMVYMDLKDFPLFLDEIGSSFDETHKSKLITFIRWMIDSYQCTQVWMISHFAADHGGLVNAQTCVMDTNNIALPEVYNEHVEMG